MLEREVEIYAINPANKVHQHQCIEINGELVGKNDVL
jgi:hypothetical protein